MLEETSKGSPRSEASSPPFDLIYITILHFDNSYCSVLLTIGIISSYTAFLISAAQLEYFLS